MTSLQVCVTVTIDCVVAQKLGLSIGACSPLYILTLNESIYCHYFSDVHLHFFLFKGNFIKHKKTCQVGNLMPLMCLPSFLVTIFLMCSSMIVRRLISSILLKDSIKYIFEAEATILFLGLGSRSLLTNSI